MDHESARLSRPEAVVVASPKPLHLCSVCLHQWRVPQFALKYPCNLPPPGGWRPSLGDRLPPPPGGGGYRCAPRGEISRGGKYNLRRSNSCAQCDTVAESKTYTRFVGERIRGIKQLLPVICVHVNAICTIHHTTGEVKKIGRRVPATQFRCVQPLARQAVPAAQEIPRDSLMDSSLRGGQHVQEIYEPRLD